MPIERKILLTILIILSTLFAGYLTYDNYYTKYSDAKAKILQYEKLLKKSKKVESKRTEEDVKVLEERIEYYKGKFFTLEESKVENTTPVIKRLLESSGVKISQYQGNRNSVRFTISGDKSALLRFLYRISKENKMYHFPLFNLRMLDNNKFQGNIEIARLHLSNKANDRFYTKEIGNKRIILPYYSSTLNPLGTAFYTPKVVEEVVETVKPEPVIIERNRPLDKFIYVGLLKKDNEVITMFKERINGRVYRFQPGQTVSNWTYIGEESGKFLFSKDEITYEVLK